MGAISFCIQLACRVPVTKLTIAAKFVEWPLFIRVTNEVGLEKLFLSRYTVRLTALHFLNFMGQTNPLHYPSPVVQRNDAAGFMKGLPSVAHGFSWLDGCVLCNWSLLSHLFPIISHNWNPFYAVTFCSLPVSENSSVQLTDFSGRMLVTNMEEETLKIACINPDWKGNTEICWTP